MPPDPAGINRGEPLYHLRAVNRAAMASEGPVPISECCGVMAWAAALPYLPNVEAVHLGQHLCGDEIADCIVDRSRSSLGCFQLGGCEIVAAFGIVADDKEPRSARGGTVLAGIQNYRPNDFVPTRHEIEATFEERTGVRISKAPNVLHDEEGRPQLGDQTEEMANEIPTGVIYLAAADVAERLAGGAAEDPAYGSSHRPPDVRSFDLGEIGPNEFRGRKIETIRGGEDRIYVKRYLRGKPRGMRSQGKSAATAEKIDNPGLPLHAKFLSPIMLARRHIRFVKDRRTETTSKGRECSTTCIRTPSR